MGNMEMYDSWRTVPQSAQKTIAGGRLKGMTDINPMWRIQELTKRFGPCGQGWGIEEPNIMFQSSGTGEIACFVTLTLWWKDESYHKVLGVGGAMFVSREKDGLRTNDEAVKMASTDAISVACKNLGMGADIYWSAGRTKYSTATDDAPAKYVCAKCGKAITDVNCTDGSTITAKDFYAKYNHLCPDCVKAERRAQEEIVGDLDEFQKIIKKERV